MIVGPARTLSVTLAGASVAAAIDALLWPAGFLLGAFLVALTAAWLFAFPLGLAFGLLQKADVTPTGTTRGQFLGGFACGLAPWLIGLLPGLVAILACAALAIALMAGLGGSAFRKPMLKPMQANSIVVLAVLLAATAIWSGGQGGATEESYSLPERSDPVAEGPDVVLISIDTLRADTIHPDRPSDYALPAMDRLRNEGIWADYAIASSNQTLPSHVTMLSGLDPMGHGVRDNLQAVPPDLAWVAQDFVRSGWRTAAVISNPLLSGDLGFGTGFEIYDDSGVPNRNRPRAFGIALEDHAVLLEILDLRRFLKVYDRALFRAHRKERHDGSGKPAGRAAHTNEQTLTHLDKLLAEDRPYFFFLHYMDPHDPYGTIAPFAGTRLSAYEDVPARYSQKEGAGFEHDVCDLIHADSRSDDPALAAEGKRGMEMLVDAYREDVAFTDAMVADILAKIDASGRPTVILLTADHGEHFGEHGLMRHSEGLWKENIHVPFMIWGAGVEAGVKLEHAPDLTDVAPTLLAYAGLPVPEHYSGLVVNRANDKQRVSLSADEKLFAIYEGRQKWLGAWDEEMLGPAKTVGFYFLDQDPDEANNRSDELPEHFLLLADEADKRDRLKLLGPAGVANEYQRQMNHELGYVGEAADAQAAAAAEANQ